MSIKWERTKKPQTESNGTLGVMQSILQIFKLKVKKNPKQWSETRQHLQEWTNSIIFIICPHSRK